MQCNIGKTDKTIRIIVGILIILWGIFDKNWWGLIGLIPLLTGIVSWCPAYSLLGIKTCADKESEVKADNQPADASNNQSSQGEESADQFNSGEQSDSSANPDDGMEKVE